MIHLYKDKDTENNANFESYASYCLSIWHQSVKNTKFWQFIREFPDKGWTKNSINRLLVTVRMLGTV